MVHGTGDLSLYTKFCDCLSVLKYGARKTQNHKVLLIIIIVVMLYFFGAFRNEIELDYDTEFNYPLNQNIVGCVDALAAQKPVLNCSIINSYEYSFVINNETKCRNENNSPVNLVLLIKSAVDNYDKRNAIRNSWGSEELFHVSVKRIFVLGISRDHTAMRKIYNEQNRFGDIIQADFFDYYHNNTIKTMMAFKWAVKYCNAKFYLFSDDDMYISVKNILRFVGNPFEYPQYLERAEHTEISEHPNKVTEYELPDHVKLVSGFLLINTRPFRSHSSKWYISLKEYPYNKWPPYVLGGSYVVSKEALKQIYYASYFTQHFRFDDVYVGMVVKKLGIELLHCNEFHMFDKANFKYALSSHGYSSSELIKTWNEQKMAGNA